MALEITDANFEELVLKSDKPVLVDFWAEWCGPCRMMAPVLETVAADPNYHAKVKIVKLNIETSKKVASESAIRSIPTLMLFKDGKVIAQKSSALSQTQLMAFLDEHL